MFFALRVPGLVKRRHVGGKYVRDHPQLPTAFEPPAVREVVTRVRALAPAITIEDLSVDPAGFADWVRAADYPLLAYHKASTEKYLEHYLSVELLQPLRNGILIDVASCRSYFPAIMRRRGLRVIEQDLAYEPGLHGDRLGGDAADMDLPDNYADALTLHCSFEHFEGDTDERFITELQRVLRPGGRAIIIPLYLHHRYLTLADPYELATSDVPVDEGAALVAYPGYGNRHGRLYDPEAFVRRVYTPAINVGLRVRLYVFENAAAISPSCYVRFALTLEKT